MSDSGRAVKSKLVLVEGIAGSGKSTIGQKLYRLLHLNGYSAHFYHEFCRPHPVLDLEADSVSSWIDQSVSKWRRFAGHLSGQDSVAVMDGALFQCGIGELLERGADDQTALDYGRTVTDLLMAVRPITVYLYQRDVETALKTVYAERPETWRKRIETIFTDTPYGRKLALSGFDLYLDFNQSLRRISDSLFEVLTMPKLAIDATDRRWDSYLERTCDLVGLREIADPFNPYDYCGTYTSVSNSKLCHIDVVNGMARVNGLFKAPKNLLPKSGNVVFVQTWPDELTFTTGNNTGRVESFRSTGPWNRIGDDIWRRINTENPRP